MVTGHRPVQDSLGPYAKRRYRAPPPAIIVVMSPFDGGPRLAGAGPLGALRPEVTLADGVLVDGLTGHAHRLAPAAREVGIALSTRAPAGEIAARLTRARGLGPAVVERELRHLVLLGLVEGAWDGVRARLGELRAGAVLAPSFLPETRLGCRLSGACCRGYLFGPIGEREKERIEALAPREALPYLPARPLFEPIGAASGLRRYRLATVGDACVFLDGHARCGLHAAFGAEAKPALCRMFPSRR